MPDPDPITVPPPGDRPAAVDTSSIMGSADLNPDVSPPSGVDVTPSAPSAAAVAPAAAPIPRVPMDWKPSYRSGIAGLVDEMRDALAGPSGHQIYTDASGNQYVGAAPDTNRGKWMRVAANIAQGMARGYAAGQGPGGQGRAALAGFQGAQEQQDRLRQQTKELSAEARQENQDRFNNAKQQLDLATSTLNLQRLKAETSQQEIEFSQKQIQWHKDQGDVDLGIIPDWQHPAAVQKNDPDFFKHLYQDGTISGVPVVDANGRGGIQVFLKTQNPDNVIIPAGHEIARYNAPKKPGDKPTLTYEKTTGPMSAKAFEAQNNGAQQQWHDWVKQDQGDKMAETERQFKEQQIKTQQSEATKNYAEAAHANAEARAKNLETEQGGPDMNDTESVARMLFQGRILPSQLNRRAKNYNAIVARADQISKEETGQGYDVAAAQARGQAYQHTIEDTLGSNGATSKKIASFDQFLAHARETSEIVNDARLTKQPWFNSPYNKISKLTGAKRSGPLIAYQTSLETTRREYQNFLAAGNVVHVDEQKRLGAIMDDNANPAQVQQALKEFAKLAADRLRAIDFQFYRGTYGSGHVPNLLSAEGQDNLRHFEVDPKSIYTTTVPQRTIPAPGPNQPTGGAGPAGGGAPAKNVVPKGAKPGRDAQGNIIGYQNPDGTVVRF